MNSLYKLLHSLNRQQQKVLKKHLTSFSSRNESNTKMWEFASYILRSKKAVPNLDECSLLIYGETRDSRIEKLKVRLYGKVLDSLMIDINIDRKNMQDDTQHIYLKMKKKLALFHVLRLSEKQHSQALEVLADITTIAKKYEYFPELVEALNYGKWMRGWKQGMKVFAKHQEEIAFYEKCSLALRKAADNYYRMLMYNNFYGKNDINKVNEMLEECITLMTYDYKNTKAATVGYYLKMLELAYYQNIQDYSSAKQIGIEMLDIIKNNVSVYRKTRVGQCLDNIAQCEIYLANYNLAIERLLEARRNYIAGTSHYLLSQEVEFEAMMHNGNLQEAEIICSKLLESAPKQQGDFRVDKYRFFNACIQFKKKNFKYVASELSQKFELSRDKVGWEISIRVLRIMSLIELERFDDAQPLVTSLQKHIERTARKSDVHERDRLILRLLREFEKEGFNRERLSTRAEDILLQLREKGKSYSWQPFTPEVIPVQEWFIAKYGISERRRNAPREKAAPKTATTRKKKIN